MKLNNEGWNCKIKKNLIKERTQNKRICNNKNEDKIQQKKIN